MFRFICLASLWTLGSATTCAVKTATSPKEFVLKKPVTERSIAIDTEINLTAEFECRKGWAKQKSTTESKADQFWMECKEVEGGKFDLELAADSAKCVPYGVISSSEYYITTMFTTTWTNYIVDGAWPFIHDKTWTWIQESASEWYNFIWDFARGIYYYFALPQ